MSLLTTIARGDVSHIEEPRRVIARTDSEWRALWATHAGPAADAPAVDMTGVNVVAAFAGQKPSAGYAIEITAQDLPDHAGQGIVLGVEERAPEPGTAAATIVTSPFDIVAVPKSAGEVTWGSGTGDPGSGTGDPGSGIRDERCGISDPGLGIRDQGSSTGLEPRTASTLAYLAGPFSGALILLAESKDRDVRFHAWQSIVALGGLGVAVLASYLLAGAALFISATVVSVMLAVATVIWIVLAIVWVICLWKAWSGARWKIPIAGDYAERFV